MCISYLGLFLLQAQLLTQVGRVRLLDALACRSVSLKPTVTIGQSGLERFCLIKRKRNFAIFHSGKASFKVDNFANVQHQASATKRSSQLKLLTSPKIKKDIQLGVCLSVSFHETRVL